MKWLRVLLVTVCILLGLASTAAGQQPPVLEPDRHVSGSPFDRFGDALAGVGDVNGDGFDDVAIVAKQVDELQVDIYHGGPNGLSTTADTCLVRPHGEDDPEAAVRGAGDVNGDGYADLLVGLADGRSETDAGSVALYLGGPDGLVPVPAAVAVGEDPGDGFGLALGAAGDVNGDGLADFIVGAPGWNQGTGRAYVFHGQALAAPTPPSLSSDLSPACGRDTGKVEDLVAPGDVLASYRFRGRLAIAEEEDGVFQTEETLYFVGAHAAADNEYGYDESLVLAESPDGEGEQVGIFAIGDEQILVEGDEQASLARTDVPDDELAEFVQFWRTPLEVLLADYGPNQETRLVGPATVNGIAATRFRLDGDDVVALLAERLGPPPEGETAATVDVWIAEAGYLARYVIDVQFEGEGYTWTWEVFAPDEVDAITVPDTLPAYGDVPQAEAVPADDADRPAAGRFRRPADVLDAYRFEAGVGIYVESEEGEEEQYTEISGAFVAAEPTGGVPQAPGQPGFRGDALYNLSIENGDPERLRIYLVGDRAVILAEEPSRPERRERRVDQSRQDVVLPEPIVLLDAFAEVIVDDGVDGVEAVGTETVEGITATQYRMDGEAFLAAVSAVLGDPGVPDDLEESDVSFWIAEEGDYLVAFEVYFVAGDGGAVYELEAGWEIGDVNADLEIRLPAGSEPRPALRPTPAP